MEKLATSVEVAGGQDEHHLLAKEGSPQYSESDGSGNAGTLGENRVTGDRKLRGGADGRLTVGLTARRADASLHRTFESLDIHAGPAERSMEDAQAA